MSVYKRGDTWWYEFTFNGARIRESAHTTSKTIARQANYSGEGSLSLESTVFKNASFHPVSTCREGVVATRKRR